MGISKTTSVLLCELADQGLLKGKLLQLGVQRISPESKKIVKIRSKALGSESIQTGTGKHRFWVALGFEKVSGLDYDDFEGADIVCDLNLPISEDNIEKFDVVFDGGTMEHVFNVKCFLENIDRLLCLGGIVIHEVPSSNAIDHGFYSFSPTLFLDYYTKQGYEVIEIFLIAKNKYKAKVYQYFPKEPGSEISENWGKKSINVWCVARKVSGLNNLETPQQNKYVNAWSLAQQPIGQILEAHFLIELNRKVKSAFKILRSRIPLFGALLGFFRKKPRLILKYQVSSNTEFV